MPLILHDKLALLIVEADVSWEDILQRSKMKRHLVKAISPRAALIEPVAVDPLLTWLRKNGHLPKVVG
jgi:hypothetical protein